MRYSAPVDMQQQDGATQVEQRGAKASAEAQSLVDLATGTRFDLSLPAQDPQAAQELVRASGVEGTVGQILLGRGLSDPARATRFLSPKLAHLTPPDAMRDRGVAAQRLATAIREREPIVIFGDYDVDGMTSAVILADILEALGGDVGVVVANRFDGGYGLSEPALERCLLQKPRVLVTCDCGSSDHPRVQAATDAGVDVIVVDHHLVPDAPLACLAFLNPHRPDCGFDFKGLCSAGLALSLGAAVRAELGASLDVRQWLDLVALGTIADQAPLTDDNRSLVTAGLRLLADGPRRPGVQALFELSGIKPGPMGASDVAFKLAPRLNAPGRLSDPSIVVSLLRAKDRARAMALAEEVERFNEERKTLEKQATQEAVAQVLEVYGPTPTGGVCVAAEGWHRGVVGITAARLVDQFQVPALVASIEDGVAHGSGRAPEGANVHAPLSACREHLRTFGGHRAAVGFSLDGERVPELRAAFAEACAATTVVSDASPQGEAPSRRVQVDVVLSPESPFAVPEADALRRLEPVGEANAEPVFYVVDAEVTQARTVGKGGDHLKLELALKGRRFSVFAFDRGGDLSHVGARFHGLVTLKPDTFRGGRAVDGRLLAMFKSA